MAVPSPDDRSRDKQHLNTCRKLGTWLMGKTVTFDEYASNVTLLIVSVSDEGMPKCIESIPSSIVGPHTDYLRTFVSVRYGDVLLGRVRWELSHPRGSPTDATSQPSCQEDRAVLA
jgi:hypothetical protein